MKNLFMSHYPQVILSIMIILVITLYVVYAMPVDSPEHFTWANLLK